VDVFGADDFSNNAKTKVVNSDEKFNVGKVWDAGPKLGNL